MKKTTKVLVLILTLALVCTGLVFAVSADSAKSDTVSYVASGENLEGSLADAIAAADEGSEVKLLGNCAVSAEIAVTKSVTVDLNGYALTTSVANAFSVSGADTTFTLTGTGSVTTAGTLVTATEDGAAINLIGTGVDGITVTHSGAKDVNFIVLKSNNFEMDNLEIVSKKGAKSNAFIENSGNSEMIIKNTSIDLDYNNVGGWDATITCFIRVGGTSHLTIEDSAIYSRNMLIDATKVDNGKNESILVKNSMLRVNDNDSSYNSSARLSIVFFSGGNTAKCSINMYDSLFECSGRMFGSESGSPEIYLNAYGTTFKVVRAESDLQHKDKHAGYLTRNMKELNLYNSESGKACKVISIDTFIVQNSGALKAHEPGVRVNLPDVTTATTLVSGINVPKTVDENGNVTEWTYAASSADDAYAWVYDPVGDPDAPFVLVDTTKEALKNPDYYRNIGFDGIRFNEYASGKYDKALVRESVAESNLTDAESYKDYTQFAASRGSFISAYEPGNAYVKYVVTPYDDTRYYHLDESGNAITDADGNKTYITAKNIYGNNYDSASTRNFNTEYNYEKTYTSYKDANGKDKCASAGADPFFILSKNQSTAALIDNTSYNTKQVIVQEMDFGCDSDVGFPSIGICIQVRQAGTGVSEAVKKIDISNAGVIGNKLDDAKNPITSLNKHEWYRFSVVCYTETNEIHFFINGAYMGKAPGYKDGTNVDDNVYFQGMRINVYKNNTHKVNSSFAIDNVSTRSYAEYQYGETTPNATTAANYISTASPRQYMGKTLTVNGKNMANWEELVAEANRTGAKIDVNNNFNLGNITDNVTVDSNGKTVTIGNESYGYVENGTNYTFNENYYYNAYYYTGDTEKLATGTYDESDFTLFGKVKLGFELDIPVYYTERIANYVNYTVDAQIGWTYDIGATATVLPKAPDLSDLELADSNKNVYYLPLFDVVPMAHIVKDASDNIVSYGISNEETHTAFTTLASGNTLVLLQDYTVEHSENYIRFSNNEPIVTSDGVTTVNGVVIDNDYTEEEIALMRAVASDFKIDLNGNTLYMSKYRIVLGQNTEFSIYSSVPGAAVDMVYSDGAKMVGPRTFNMGYIDPTNVGKWQESAATMLKNMNSRYNFGTYTDRSGNVVKSEMFTMTGDVIFEAASADSSCSFNITNVAANRVSTVSWATIVTRFFDGKINVKDSIIASYGISSKHFAVTVMQDAAGTIHPEIVFDSCLFISDKPTENFVSNGGPSSNASKNIIFNNCISNARLNAAERDHVYFGEGTSSLHMLVGGNFVSDGLIEAYCWDPMTVDGFAESGAYFIKLPKPVYDSSTGKINYDNYAYFVNNGYAKTFEAEYPGVAYYELPLLTTKIVKQEDAVKVSFSRLDGSEAIYSYYVKGTDVKTMFVGSDRKSVNNWDLKLEYRTYNANAVTLTYTGWEALPTNVQEDVVIKPTYTVAPNVSGFKANLSLYADFDVNLYIPAQYADYIKLAVAENDKSLTKVTIAETEYLMATVSQKCNMAGDAIVFEVNIAEEVDGKLCEAKAIVTMSIASYATQVLENENFTDADKVLMYYMLNYANEAEKYIDGTEDEAIANALNTASVYADKYNVDYAFDTIFDTADIAKAFSNATLDIESTPAFVFTLVDGFEGKITVTYGGGLNVREYTVSAADSRRIAIEGMKVYNFGTVITVSAAGTVNGEAVEAEGSYNLETFAKYHTDNAANTESETKEASEACLPLVKALFAYSEVAELYKTKTLANALVGAAE
ncbi:MAG: hypothetical protein E7673_04580 [Ruminococcaceae bacterium]|nr:hypothetical protein [Oscillospiraceae bacterium]